MTEKLTTSIDEMIQNARQLRERFLADVYRPGYHFVMPEDLGIPGDPNGAFFANGRYHLMYLYNRRQVGFCWGHVSSHDLIHWRHHPDAIGPGDGDEGCFSGGAFVDEDGTAYISFWKLWGDKGIGLAKSSDAHYERWEKFSEPAIPATRWGILEIKESTGKPLFLACADPSNIWKKDDVYYMQTGNLCVLNEYGRKPEHPLHHEMRGDWVDLFRSTDLENWEYVHRFYNHDNSDRWTDGSEDDMCPSFLPLPSKPEGGKPSGKYLQLFIAHNKGCQYYIGSYDHEGDKFIPEIHGRMSWVDNTFFAPEALIDAKGRHIMWAWLRDNPGDEKSEIKRGWSGVYGLPRLLWLGEDGSLRQRVPPEFQGLRINEKNWTDEIIQDGVKKELSGINGLSCELEIDMVSLDARKSGLVVRATAGGEEETILYYDAEEECLVFDARKSSAAGFGRCVLEKAPLKFKAGEKICLNVFIDKCVVEIFANDRQAIARRVFPTRQDSTQIHLFSLGGKTIFHKISAWEMMPSNPY
jgi:beta-fructofuranosidase